MREKTTLESLRRKLAPFSDGYGTALADPLDIDRFLASGPHRFYDSALDAPPSVKAVETLVKLGIPRQFLTSRGVVGEAVALLKVRREKSLASVRAARLLRDAGAERPWSVRFIDVRRGDGPLAGGFKRRGARGDPTSHEPQTITAYDMQLNRTDRR